MDPVKKEIDHYTQRNSKEINDVRNLLKIHFQELIDLEKLIVLPLICSKSWEIDPVVYFSQDNRRFYTNYIVRQIEWKDSKVDMSNELIGAYINDKWHFIQGSVTYYPRADYKSDVSKPFTFEELSYLLNRRMFSNIVTKEKGKYEVSNEFFARSLKKLDSSNTEGDSLFLSIVNAYSTKIASKKDLEEIRKQQKNSKAPFIAKPSLWTRWFGKKKLFDSREWKNSISK